MTLMVYINDINDNNIYYVEFTSFSKCQSQRHGEQSHDHAAGGIEQEDGVVALLQQCEDFFREGGERGESSAQSHAEKQV